MATMNIAGLTPVDDPAYRYKMPRLQAKVEGRGNGIKTVIVNVTDIGLSLNREASEITKFFGCELGSQTTFAPDRAVVNGAHTPQSLQEQLCKYIEKFVLCTQCKLPETHYKIKAGIIDQKCLACGEKKSVDMTHKLTTFILAQHKKTKSEKQDKEKAEKGADKTTDKGTDKAAEKAEKKEKKLAAAAASTADAAAPTPTKEKKSKKSKKDKRDRGASPSLEDGAAEGETPAEPLAADPGSPSPADDDVDLESDKVAVG